MITAKKRDEYIDQVRQNKYSKVVPIKGERDNDTGYAWLQLAYYSFLTIQRNLSNIEKIKTTDSFELLIHPDTPLYLRDYLKHYSNDELLFLNQKRRTAQEGLNYLANAIDTELSRRDIKRKE